MSPEQMQAQEVDHRTDIWALGCVLYEMVAAQRAFRGEYAQAMAYEIVHEEPETTDRVAHRRAHRVGVYGRQVP